MAAIQAGHTAALMENRGRHAAECEALNQQHRATRQLLQDEENTSAMLRRQVGSMEAEHEQRHARFALQFAESESQLKSRIEALEQTNAELL